MSKIGVIFVNIGTPKTPFKKDVKKYLKEFLSDRRVIDIHYIARKILVYGLIVPFRSSKTSHSYQKVWYAEGSPLLKHSYSFLKKVSSYVGSEYELILAMRYGEPSLESALNQLKNCNKLILFPLYPQYASSSTGSAIAHFMKLMNASWNIPQIKIAAPFFDNKGYIHSYASIISESRKQHQWQHLVFSYHGLPVRHIKKSACPYISSCRKGLCCPENPAGISFCYRSQCFRTTKLIAEKLELAKEGYSISFQSRLGRQPWIQPNTIETLKKLRSSGIRKIAVVCPSFVVDCLETLEEMGIVEKEKWLKNGGDSFTLIPSLNDHDQWVTSACEMIQDI